MLSGRPQAESHVGEVDRIQWCRRVVRRIHRLIAAQVLQPFDQRARQLGRHRDRAEPARARLQTPRDGRVMQFLAHPVTPR